MTSEHAPQCTACPSVSVSERAPGCILRPLTESPVAHNSMYIKLTSRAWNKCVVPLLDIYAELNGEKEVPYDFVIPSEAPWEQKVWGVRLGFIVG
ncbi:hypothetical protein PHYSODRAFT_330259 [Phytophthora sojae]|uniref:Uncharacterized protein n=1 Tax=Phytophthora sojae (strain P6497) TaxID=1094619 RepID=G4Z787_PHYSP|nr:hypothetical protein PHYSODRAFT_330259 [Phytophthora sojae]EGZ22471.1 hypothetical protein PHYSODRAFT_330259 [Phytophthora sojae]|eukprot:XP_009525188.1 hypothetical protein PHYSODRAFT_330259 [Phytophthora sojae]